MFKKEVLNADILNKEYDVVVYMITYNGSKTIERAIKGVLKQETQYSFYLVIFDDASTDGNADIIRKYAKEYPDKIVAILGQENIFNWPNRQSVYDWITDNFYRAKYVASCEGDDFWIDAKKLEIQVSYMKKNPDCTMTGHNGLFFNVSNSEIESIDAIKHECDVPIETIIEHRKGCFPTCSFVIKKELIKLPKYYNEVEFGDWNAMLYCATKGRVHYFDRIMGAYQIGNNASWTNSLKKDKEKFIRHYSNVVRWLLLYNKETGGRYNDVLNNQLDNYYEGIVSCGRDISRLEYECLVGEAMIDYHDGMYDDIKSEIVKRYEYMINEKEAILCFEKKYNHIFIMGAGEYAKLFYERHDNKCDIEGFVVSNDQKHEGMIFGKAVYKLNEIEYNKDECGLMIAISKSIKNEVEKSLKSNGFENYIWVHR